MEYWYLDSLAGSGKTEAAIKAIVHDAIHHKRKSALLAPSTALCREIEGRARDMVQIRLRKRAKNIRITRIDGTNSANVVGDLVAFLREAQTEDRRDDGEILIMTQQAYMRLPYWHRKECWCAYVDEVPGVTFAAALNLPVNHEFLTQHLRLAESDGIYAPVEVIDGHEEAVEAIAENAERDQITAVIRDIAKKVIDPHWRLETHVANWHRHLEGTVEVREEADEDARAWDASKHPLSFFATLRPTVFAGFARTTIMGANFEDSLLCKLWSQQGVRFLERDDLKRDLRYTKHPNGHRLHIHFASNAEWSKRLARSDHPAGDRTWQEWLMQQVRDFAEPHPFLYSSNKDQADLAAKLLPEGTRLPNSPFGLNEYAGYHYVACVGAYLPTPQMARYLAAHDVSVDEATTAQHREQLYQSLMRSSLRDLTANEMCHVMVPDEATAIWLAEKFDPKNPPLLGPIATFTIRYRPNRKYDTKAERDSAYRDRKVKANQQVLTEVIEEFLHQAEIRFDRTEDEDFGHLHEFLWQNRATLSFKGFKGNRRTNSLQNLPVLPGTAHGKVAKTSHYPLPVMSLGEWVAWMRSLSEAARTKTENLLLSPAYYCPDRTDPDMDARRKRGEGPRKYGRHNVAFAQIIVLDFEKGMLTPEDFRRIFPNLFMLLHASTNANPEENRWHALIVCDAAMSAETYLHIARRIKRILERDHGYGSRPGLKKPYHGLDKSVLRPESGVYMPCRPKDPSQAFFYVQEAQPLNVAKWIEHDFDVRIAPPPPPPPEKPKTRHEQTQLEQKIEDAKQRYRDVLDGTGRQQAFFALAVRLYRLGLDGFDLTQHLHDADYDGHQAERGQVERCARRAPIYAGWINR